MYLACCFSARLFPDRLGAGTLYDVASAQTRLAESPAGRAQAAYGLAFRRVLVRLAVGDVDPGALAGMLE